MRQNKPETQSLVVPDGDGSAKKSGYDTLGGSKGTSAGLGDGFTGWSGSLQAFHQAIFHVVVYMVLGIVFYSFILETQFTVIQSVYFCVTIFTTVGYGDMSPNSSTAGMIFTMFFALYGIIILGTFLGILGDMAVERQEKLYQEIKKQTSNAFLDTMLATNPDENVEESTENAGSLANDIYQIAKEQRFKFLLVLILAMPVIILEKWSVVEGLYWIVITSTTVGFGDEFPQHEWSQILCILYIPVAVFVGGVFLGSVASSYVDKRNDAIEDQFLKRALNEGALDKMDSNDDDAVTKDEFLVYMLKILGKVDPEDIEKILRLFDNLDKDGSGSLTKADLNFIPAQTSKLSRFRTAFVKVRHVIENA
jgi:potassium channel subfamily K